MAVKPLLGVAANKYILKQKQTHIEIEISFKAREHLYCCGDVARIQQIYHSARRELVTDLHAPYDGHEDEQKTFSRRVLSDVGGRGQRHPPVAPEEEEGGRRQHYHRFRETPCGTQEIGAFRARVSGHSFVYATVQPVHHLF